MAQSVMQSEETDLEVTNHTVKDLKKEMLAEDCQERGELEAEASKLVFKNLYTARLVRYDTLWTVNSLAKQVRKWNRACDKRLQRLMAYLYHKYNYVQMCWVGHDLNKCQLARFMDASFAGDLQDKTHSQ